MSSIINTTASYQYLTSDSKSANQQPSTSAIPSSSDVVFSTTPLGFAETSPDFVSSIISWTNASESRQFSTDSTTNITNNGSLSTNNATLPPEVCDEIYTNFTNGNNLVFDNQSLVRVVVTWIVFLISAAGNSFVLASITIRRPRRTRSNPHIMMTHLTLANLAFTVFLLPTDAIWQTTKQWYGGDGLCRIINVLKQFAMYSSSAMVVVMGIDRVANLMCPVSRERQRRRIKRMLATAWIFSLINAIPAAAIFYVIDDYVVDRRCPQHVVVQCIDLKVVKGANLNGYYLYSMFISFFGPLICILVCYILIAIAISKMARLSKEAQKRSLKQTSGSKRGLDRARRISLIVTALITATFILCWGPYYVTGLIHWFHEELKMPRAVTDFTFMSVYLNPMLHPLITIWLIKEIRESIVNQFHRNPRSYQKPPKKKSSPRKIVHSKDKNGATELLPKDKNGSSKTTTKTKQVWL